MTNTRKPKAAPKSEPMSTPAQSARRAKAAAPKGDPAEIGAALVALLAEAEPPKAPRTLAVTTGECTCRTCERLLPVTKFPTKAASKDGTVERDTRCRECRDAARDAKKAVAAKAA